MVQGLHLSHSAYLAQLHALLGRFPMAPMTATFRLADESAIDFMVGFLGPAVRPSCIMRPEFIRWTMKGRRHPHGGGPVVLEVLNH